MKVSVEFILRIIGMIFIGVIAGIWGFSLGGDNFAESIRYTAIIGLLGALTGLVLTPYVTTRPARAVRMRLGRLSAETCPRWASTSCFTIARPSPAPPVAREREGSAR
mgnify:CR=1 FL=1